MHNNKPYIVNILYIVIAHIFITTTFIQPAAAESPLYVSGSVGAYFRDNVTNNSETFHNNLGRVGPGTNTMTYTPGPTINLAMGYKLLEQLRIESELGYTHYLTDTASPRSTNGAFPALNGSRLNANSGEHNRYMATVNAFYDVPLERNLTPYFGGGFGVTHSSGSTARFTTSLGGTFSQKSTNSDAATILGEIGFSVKISNSISVVPAYRFVHLFNSGSVTEENGHILKLGIHYSF